jgi:hypothetical protein
VIIETNGDDSFQKRHSRMQRSVMRKISLSNANYAIPDDNQSKRRAKITYTTNPKIRNLKFKRLNCKTTFPEDILPNLKYAQNAKTEKVAGHLQLITTSYQGFLKLGFANWLPIQSQHPQNHNRKPKMHSPSPLIY